VPQDFAERDLRPLLRPKFLPIVASNTLAVTLLRKANGRIDGFVVEGPTAGGHNAPPRGKPQWSGAGEPIYGERDKVDLQKMRELGLPFWLAGGYGSAEKLREALAAGATGVQVGTAFAFCAESDLRDDYKQALLKKALSGETKVFTDSSASPTGYPFKVAQLEGTISEPEVYLARPRICDLGYLREAFRTAAGTIDYRCAAQPVSIYLSKGGEIEDTVGRICLCNALVANVGHPQVRAGNYVETGLVTSGDDLSEIPSFLPPGMPDYNAADVIAKLLDA
jgi:nitronate monooxygenase